MVGLVRVIEPPCKNGKKILFSTEMFCYCIISSRVLYSSTNHARTLLITFVCANREKHKRGIGTESAHLLGFRLIPIPDPPLKDSLTHFTRQRPDMPVLAYV